MKDELASVDRVGSEQKVYEVNVEVPTIIVEPPYEGGEPEVFVQWFAEFSKIESLKRKHGDTFSERLRQMQFSFPVPIPVDDVHWMGHPEYFKVILLGQLKDWPDEVAEISKSGSPDSWILWVTSSYYGGPTSGGDNSQACFYIPLKSIVLADETLGLITPRKYCDVAVLDQEREAYQRWAYH